MNFPRTLVLNAVPATDVLTTPFVPKSKIENPKSKIHEGGFSGGARPFTFESWLAMARGDS